jgi:hypothetical protein
MPLSPFQFYMFSPARDLADPAKTLHSEAGPTGTSDASDPKYQDLKNKKLKEAKTGGVNDGRNSAEHGKPTLYESIRDRGIQKPVVMAAPFSEEGSTNPLDYRPEIYTGYHRVFAQNDINPDAEVPVVWLPQNHEEIAAMYQEQEAPLD